ncbi:hypothetical protein IWZ01DRAFT_227145 [Phyllosticta capitalensis]
MCDAGNFKASNHHFCPFLVAKPFNTHAFDSLFSFSDPPPLPPFSHPHPYRTLAPNKLQTPLARASGSIPADFALWSLTHTRSTLPDNPTALPFPRLSPTQTHQNSLPSPVTAAPFYKRSLPYVVPLIGPHFFLGNLSWPFFVRLKPAWLEPFGASWRRVNGSLSGTECGGGQRDCWTLNVMRREWCGGPMRCGGVRWHLQAALDLGADFVCMLCVLFGCSAFALSSFDVCPPFLQDASVLSSSRSPHQVHRQRAVTGNWKG